MTAVEEGALGEKLVHLRNSRSGYLSTVTTKLNEIDALLSNDGNLERVREKLSEFVTAFEKFKEAHILYMSFVEDEDCIARCQESFDREVVRKDNFIQRVQEWIVRVEEAVRLDAQIRPQDSVSRTGSRSTSKPSRRSEHSSRSGSHKSSGTSLSVVRAKEAARMAELKAEAAILKKRQFLEEQRFRLKQDEKRLTLETEIAKSKAREDALASMDPNRRLVVPEPKGVESKPGSVVLNQTTSEMRSRVPVQSLPVARGFPTHNPEAPEWQHHPSVINKRKSSSDSSHSGAPSSPSERAFHETLELHQHQNILQQQQNNIVEMLVTQQKKSSLPSPRVPNFDGDPLEYGSFIRAFENIIESKTSSSSERLYYLEQFKSL